MLVDDLPAFIEGVTVGPLGEQFISHYHLTFNKADNGKWHGGYIHYPTGQWLLTINNADTLDELGIRLDGRLSRYIKAHIRPPRTLQDLPNSATVSNANITEGRIMADDQKLSHGQKLVGVRFNPSKDSKVDELKQHAAAMIDILEDINGSGQQDTDTDMLQESAVATIIAAQMAAVKRATWGLNEQQSAPATGEDATPSGTTSNGTPTVTGGNTADPLNNQDGGQNDQQQQ